MRAERAQRHSRFQIFFPSALNVYGGSQFGRAVGAAVVTTGATPVADMTTGLGRGAATVSTGGGAIGRSVVVVEAEADAIAASTSVFAVELAALADGVALASSAALGGAERDEASALEPAAAEAPDRCV